MNILFSTVVGSVPDYFDISISRTIRVELPTPSFGLRFIKANVPGIEILEYPSEEEFEKKLSGVDVLGVSFYMKDLPIVRRMVEKARNVGVKEVWGGNYGVLCEEAETLFDKTFSGYAEEELSQLLYGRSVSEIQHPVLDTHIGLRFTPLRLKYGFIFTSRGCPNKCSFCQTDAFVGERSLVPLSSIEAVLKEYKRQQINFVFIMDENFIAHSGHSKQVVELLDKMNFAWGMMTRPENLRGRVSEFRDKGLIDCLIGLESLRQDRLNSINRGSKTENLLEVVEELQQNDIYIHATYIIGFEDDTVDSIKEDIDHIAELGIDSFQICVMTPYPETALWDELGASYSFSDDVSLYDSYHLSWEHPHISKQEMDELLRWAQKKVYPVKNVIHGLAKVRRNKILERAPLWVRISRTF